MDYLSEGERRDHGDGMGLEVVTQLAPSQDYRVQQFLDMRIPCLGLGQHFADVVHRPLDKQSMTLLLSFHYDHRADHLDRRSYV